MFKILPEIMSIGPNVKKVPGQPVRLQNEKDGFVNLSEMSKLELVDLLGRETKLLSNKNFIAKLPDKGEKIKNFHSKIETELKKREEHDKLCNLISNLSVNESKAALNKLEWTRDCDSLDDRKTEIVPKNVVDETDPLQLLATHSSTSASQKKILQVEESELQKPDLNEKNATELDIDLYAQHLCRLIDRKSEDKLERKFYPNKSLNKTFTKSTPSTKEPEVSAAYIPKSISGHTKLISLEESILVHQEQQKYLKNIEINVAVEKLMQKCAVKTKLPKRFTTSYREPEHESTDDDDSYVTEENSDEECENEENTSNLSDVD